MKATLEFQLPEEQAEHESALHGADWRAAVEEMDQQLRAWTKYGHQFKSLDAALDGARDRLRQILEERELRL